MKDYAPAWGCSLAWALVPSLAKLGMSQGFPPIAGALVAIAVNLLALSFIVRLVGKRKSLKVLDRRSLLFVVLCGVVTGLAGLTYFTALNSGSVSLVIAITSGGQPIASLLLAFVFLRRKEKLGWAAALGTLLVVAGLYLVLL